MIKLLEWLIRCRRKKSSVINDLNSIAWIVFDIIIENTKEKQKQHSNRKQETPNKQKKKIRTITIK